MNEYQFNWRTDLGKASLRSEIQAEEKRSKN